MSTNSPSNQNISPTGNGQPSVPVGQQQQSSVQNHRQQQPANLLRPPQLQPHSTQQQQQPHQQHQVMQILYQLQQQQTVISQLMQRQEEFAQQQQQALILQQEQIIRSTMSAINQQLPTHPEQILDSLASNIIEFRYDPDSNVTFEAWYTRYDGLFSKDAARLDDEAKVRLLLRKLGPSEHDRYVSYILPKLPKDINFENTIIKLKSLFGTPESVISKRYRCLQVTKQPTEDYKAYACRLNKLCVEFELGKLTEDQFKCLMFVCGLKSEEDGEIRTRLLIRMEENREVSLEHISDECQRLLSIKHDTAMIEGAPAAVSIKSIRRKQSSEKQSVIQQECTTESSTEENEKAPSTPCWNCGSMHYSANCTYKNHKCKECGQLGHKEGYCMSAKKARKKFKQRKPFEIKSVFTDNLQNRRFVQVVMNGRPTSLQLDTGSDFSVISEKTWKRIGEPASTPASVKAFSASGKPLKILSQFISDVTINNITHRARVFVTKQQLHLLGLDFVDLFNLGEVPLTEFCSNQ